MKRQITLLFGIGILNLILFLGVFILFQNEYIYHNTLGLVSENYERIGDWNNFEIKKVSKPFLQIEKDHFDTWDAAIYKCISERMYQPETKCYGQVRAAFFPLFPLLWKLTGSSTIGISMINYLLFMISIGVLIWQFLQTTLYSKYLLYALFISLPSTIVYYLPYTEALFLFTATIMVLGILNKKYWIFFVGCFLMCMVRPATVFVLIPILLIEFLLLLKTKNFSAFLKEAVLKSVPFILAYLCVIWIQYFYTNTWTAFWEAQKSWSGGIQVFRQISDWSIEGFGLTSFAIFFVCIPVFLLFLYILINKFKNQDPYFLKIANYQVEYLELVSMLYLIGIFLFTCLTSGGNLHSFFRFILASPFFYIFLIIFLNSYSQMSTKWTIRIFSMLTIALFLFLYIVNYGGNRFQFSFFGLYLLVATSLFLIRYKSLTRSLQILIAIGLILLNTIWNTYLWNMFFSNGWIFT
ncbi:MAG: hypothetical protein IPO78_15420 [Saprospiraceae bacterium]|nr:hypothetical protein [Saprospiraceae bacterium]